MATYTKKKPLTIAKVYGKSLDDINTYKLIELPIKVEIPEEYQYSRGDISFCIIQELVKGFSLEVYNKAKEKENRDE